MVFVVHLRHGLQETRVGGVTVFKGGDRPPPEPRKDALDLCK